MSAPSEQAESSQSPSSRLELGLLLGLVFYAIFSQIKTFYLVPDGQLNDDAAYLLRALKIWDPSNFVALQDPLNFSPGWPVLLVPFLGLSDNPYLVGRCVAVLLTILTVPLLYYWFKSWSKDELCSAGLVLLFLNSPQVLMLGSSLMSEPFYFFLIVLCFVGVERIKWAPGFLLLGALSAWNVQVRVESMAVVLAISLALFFHQDRGKKLAYYWVGFILSMFLSRILTSSASESSHLGSSLGIFQGKNFQNPFSYPLIYGKNVAFLSVDSVTGYRGNFALILWLLVLGLAIWCFYHAGKPALRKWAAEPALWWIPGFFVGLSLWPFYSARYWPLWTVMSLGFVLSISPLKLRRALLVLLLLSQVSSLVTNFGNGEKAKLFQEKIYRPYYQSFATARRVMTLNFARVESIAFVPTSEPLTRRDYQSLPIAMAHFQCDVVEWEVKKRHLVAYTGEEARPYPPQALAYLRSSTLYEPFAKCAFSESFRLVADPEKLKVAGSLFSQADQTPDPKERLERLNQVLALVSDLPEARLARIRTLEELNPGDQVAERELKALAEQYPDLRI